MSASAISRDQAKEMLLAVLATENCCSAKELLADGVDVRERLPNRIADPRHRRFLPRPEPDFGVVCCGRGTVVSASASILEAFRGVFSGADRDSVFDVHRLAAVGKMLEGQEPRHFGPYLRFACNSGDLRTIPAPSSVRISAGGPGASVGLRAADWPHSLPERPGRPIKAITLAYKGDDVIGVATASEDAPGLWQIGVDVMPGERGRGVGKALAAALAGAAIDYGAVPYYGTTAANIPSIRAALSTGFWPAWTEVLVRRKSDPREADKPAKPTTEAEA